MSSFGEEDFQTFTLNLLRSNFGYYFANNASGACYLNFNYTYPRNIRAQCLRVMLNSFGEEDFQRFALNLPCSNCFGYYFGDNIGCNTI